jgi:hypothetical protein
LTEKHESYIYVTQKQDELWGVGTKAA